MTLSESRRLLLVCGEPIGRQMAGPAIRAFELARAVSAAGSTVTLAAPAAAERAPLPDGVRQVPLANRLLRDLVQDHDCALIGAGLLSRFPALYRASLPLAVDLYDPVPFEAAELYRDGPALVARTALREAASNLRLELRRADLILCASDRQRDLWTGALAAVGRIDAELYARDPSLDLLVRVAPFGIAAEPPAPGRAIRGVIPGIEAGDIVVLWAGGLHRWFDPALVVSAVSLLAPDLPALRVVFMGGSPPNPRLQRHGVAEELRAQAEGLGLLGKHVFFVDEWVPYASRGAYLLDADIGISTHHDTAESRYAWRTRLLDYLWAGLPVVCSDGDALAADMAARGIATTAAPGDLEGLCEAIRTVVASADGRGGAAAAADVMAGELRWSRAARPLVEWVADPRRTGHPVRLTPAAGARWAMYAAKAREAMPREGWRGVLQRARRFDDRD